VRNFEGRVKESEGTEKFRGKFESGRGFE